MEIAKNETLQHIKALTEFHGAPGFEQDLRAYIKKKWNHTLTSSSITVWVDFTR